MTKTDQEMCRKYERNMKTMWKLTKTHLFHIIFIFILYFFHILDPKWRQGPGRDPGPAGPGRARRHFGLKIWKKYEIHMEIIWNKCDLSLVHIIFIFISYFLHIALPIFFIFFWMGHLYSSPMPATYNTAYTEVLGTEQYNLYDHVIQTLLPWMCYDCHPPPSSETNILI